MKKLAMILASIMAVSMLAACGTSNSDVASGPTSTSGSVSSSVTSQVAQDTDLNTVMDKLFENLPEDQVPMMMTNPDGSKYAALTDENSEYNVGVSRDSYVEGICAEAAINVQAHSVCLVKAESPEKAAELAKQISEKANPNKWICVGAEHETVAYAGDTVLLSMTFNTLAQPILDNFKAQFGEDNVTVVLDKDLSQDMAPASGDSAVAPL